MSRQPTVHSIVLDAAPLLLNEPPISTLLEKSERIFTVPPVLAEIRDQAARIRVEATVVPFLTVRSPLPESVSTVREFSSKSGDVGTLSHADIQILALAYELECERNHGDWRLRRTPGQKELNGKPPKLDPGEDTNLATSGANEEGCSQKPNEPAKETDVILKSGPFEENMSSASAQGNASGSRDCNDLPTDFKSLELAEKISEVRHGHRSAGFSTQKLQIINETLTEELGQSKPPSNSDDEVSGSDSEGWITPSNIQRRREASDSRPLGSAKTPQILQVATITSDFAMQNVLLLMNLNLLSPSLTRISHIRTTVLRCHGCFATTKDHSKQFCPRCGQATLTRVTCTTNAADGSFRLHLKKNMQWSSRGNRYSIPKPVSGTSSSRPTRANRGKGGKNGWGKELILAEDQVEYGRALKARERESRASRDLMDEDRLPGIFSQQKPIGGKIRIGAGRDVNSRKR